MTFSIQEKLLHFKQPAGTSRGVYTTRRIWLLTVEHGGRTAIGECAPLPQLSCDDIPDYEAVLRRFCDIIEATGSIPYDEMRNYPSMLFGVETALAQLSRTDGLLYDTPFSHGEEGIPINGLVWMGTHDEMLSRLKEKLKLGFRCVKLKIGAIDLAKELDLIQHIRKHFSRKEVELRVDANPPWSDGLRMIYCGLMVSSRRIFSSVEFTPISSSSRAIGSGDSWQSCAISLHCCAIMGCSML